MRRFSRAGYSLIETLVAFAVASVVFGIVATTMHAVFVADQRATTSMHVAHAQWRMARDFRRDAHRATGVSLLHGPESEEPKGVEFRFDDDASQGVYRLQGPAIQFELRRDSQLVRRESYPLLSGSSVRWQLEEQESQMIVALQIELAEEAIASGAAVPAIRIEAAVGVQAIAKGIHP